MTLLEAKIFGKGSNLISRELEPLTSHEFRVDAKHYVPMRAMPLDVHEPNPKREPRGIPSKEQAEEYEFLRHKLISYQNKSVPVVLYRAISRKVEDYRCNFDWRDQVIENEGRKGLVSAFGEVILPPEFFEIPERYSSIYGEVPLIPVGLGNKYALAHTGESGALATPYEYDDAFLIPYSEGMFYGVRIGLKWAVLKYDSLGLRDITGFVLDAIYPALVNDNYETRIWPVMSDGKWGFISPKHYIAPEYDDFMMDSHTGNVTIYKDGHEVEKIETELPF